MIEVSHLCKRYQGAVALDDVSFTIETGTVCGLLGPNGAGKSTTMNIMAGCLAATSGEVRYDGHEIYADMREAKREIGYLPEIPPLYGEMSPREYLTFVGRAKGLSRQETLDAIDRLGAACGISDVLDRLISNLSKGYRQRVGIAEALMGDPRVVILDEPTVGLDPVQIVEIRELVKNLARDRTVLVSSHILSEIRAICDQIVMIREGRIVANDTPDNLERHVEGPATIAVTAETDPASLQEALQNVADVRIVEIGPSDDAGCSCARLETDHDVDARGAVARTLMDHGILVVGMSRTTATLEDVFLELASDSKHLPPRQDGSPANPQAAASDRADSQEEGR